MAHDLSASCLFCRASLKPGELVVFRKETHVLVKEDHHGNEASKGSGFARPSAQ